VFQAAPGVCQVFSAQLQLVLLLIAATSPTHQPQEMLLLLPAHWHSQAHSQQQQQQQQQQQSLTTGCAHSRVLQSPSLSHCLPWETPGLLPLRLLLPLLPQLTG